MLKIHSLHSKSSEITDLNIFNRTQIHQTFCNKNGFLNSNEWHKSVEAIKEYKSIVQERAILLQSIENYVELHKEMQNNIIHDIPSFGENIVVSGLDSNNICIGDKFKIKGNHSNLIIQVSSPRKPCYKVDKKHKSVYGLKGLKRYSLTNGLAGWFCRVINEGIISENDTFELIDRVHSGWSLTKISKMMYGNGNYKIQSACKVKWIDSIDELDKLINCSELAFCEWKEELIEVRKNFA